MMAAVLLHTFLKTEFKENKYDLASSLTVIYYCTVTKQKCTHRHRKQIMVTKGKSGGTGEGGGIN